jgi:hypothetical protein
MKRCCLTGENRPELRNQVYSRSGYQCNAASLASALLALAIPKCPLCLIAWAGIAGISAAGQKILLNWWLLPGLAGLLFLPALALALRRRPFEMSKVWWVISAAACVEALTIYRL